MMMDYPGSTWSTFKSRLLRQAESMPKINVETAFDEAVDHYMHSSQNKGDWFCFVNTISEVFKQLARREYVYRTQLRETFTELTELKKRVQKMERLAAAVEGFDSSDYIEVEDVKTTLNCVYLIRDVDVSGFYKIGVANNLKRRLRELTICPFRIKVVHVIPTDNPYSLEYQLHTRYARKRVRGEWFALTAQDVLDIVNTDAGEPR